MKSASVVSSALRGSISGMAVLAGVAVLFSGCQKKEVPPPPVPVQAVSPLTINQAFYGVTPEGDTITMYTLSNGNNMEVKLINYGATVVSIRVPDRNGLVEDVTLGFDSLSGYVGCTSYIGASIGRYANRIGKAKFKLDGVTYNVTKNNGENHLHGGAKGFHKAIWKAAGFKTADSVGVIFTYLSKDGEEGFPGNLSVTNVYTLKADNSLSNVYSAATDKNSVVNLTHHSYFNLSGDAKRDILEHELLVVADSFTPVDKGLIPTGKISPLKGTDLDFSTPTAVGARIAKVEGGYDHNYISRRQGAGLELLARMYEPASGRVMEVLSTEPAIQFYSGNFLDGTTIGKGGKAYPKYYAFCLEPQHYPDAPNHANFPSTLLKPGETYRNVIVFKFSAK